MDVRNANASMLSHLHDLASLKGLSDQQIIEALNDAIVKALTRDDPDARIQVIVDGVSGATSIVKLYKVVASAEAEEFDDINEIALVDAQKIMPDAQVGNDYPQIIPIEKVSVDVVRHIVQLFKQRVTEMSNSLVAQKWAPYIGKVVSGEVEALRAGRGGLQRGDYSVNIIDGIPSADGASVHQGYLRRSEIIPGETFVPRQAYLFVIKDVKEQSRGWPVILSRTDERLLACFLTENVPEIKDGIVEIKKIVRAPGMKAKVAVISHQPTVDPLQAVLGPRGAHVKSISAHLHNEIIDVLLWSDDDLQMIVNAVAPVPIIAYNILEDSARERYLELYVEARLLPNVIGRGGINIKLLGKLVNWNIDVKPIDEAVTTDPNFTYNTLQAQGVSYVALEQLMRDTRPAARYKSSPPPTTSYSTKTAGSDDIVVDLETPPATKPHDDPLRMARFGRGRNKDFAPRQLHLKPLPTNLGDNVSGVSESVEIASSDVRKDVVFEPAVAVAPVVSAATPEVVAEVSTNEVNPVVAAPVVKKPKEKGKDKTKPVKGLRGKVQALDDFAGLDDLSGLTQLMDDSNE